MADIYLGRIVAVARNLDGRLSAMYRVSSRSFPNRRAALSADRQAVSIIPKPGHEGDITKNPYIAYNCARLVGELAVVTNGSHTDPVAEKLLSGMCPRDALVYALAAMDYEKDSYNTPRIAAVVQRNNPFGWLGVVRHDGLEVRAFDLELGACVHLSTYEHNTPREQYKSLEFNARSADEACNYVLGEGPFAGFSNPVTAVCALEGADGFALAARDAAC